MSICRRCLVLLLNECECMSTHHWQLVKVQQLFDQTSQHVLTLPHLIKGPENKYQLNQKGKQVR